MLVHDAGTGLWRAAASRDELRRSVRRMFEFRYRRFLYSADTRSYAPYEWRAHELQTPTASGLSAREVFERRVNSGANLIDVRVPSIGKMLVTEVLNPFYVFQVFSFSIWMWEAYYYYCAAIMLTSIVSLVVELVSMYRNWVKLAAMAVVKRDVCVLRDAQWRTVCSSDLVVGDVVQIEQNTTLPFDGALVAGSSVINEAMLTGESVPVTKAAPPADSTGGAGGASSSSSSHNKHHRSHHGAARHHHAADAEQQRRQQEAKAQLFCGTHVLQTRGPRVRRRGDGGSALSSAASALPVPPSSMTSALSLGSGRSSPTAQQTPVLARVTRCGFDTTKGQLVRSILFPKPTSFHFHRDSLLFILMLALLAVAGGVFAIVRLVFFGDEAARIAQRVCDLVTVVVPPALPACLMIGTSFAVFRLRKQKILCIAPTRINPSGSIDVFCFDKTGTLTEDGLNLHGVQPVLAARAKGGSAAGGGARFDEVFASVSRTPDELQRLLASCNGLTVVNGEVAGDPLEVSLLDSTQWSLEDHGHVAVVRPPRNASGSGVAPLRIVRRLDFSSDVARMSVLVREDRSLMLVDADAIAAGLDDDDDDDDENGDDNGVDDANGPGGSVRSSRPGGADSELKLYLKGAPEIVKSLCVPGSVPADFDEIVQRHTRLGLRVLACAMRVFAAGPEALGARHMTRTELERELVLVGLILMQNKVKPQSRPALETLTGAGVHCVMVTGDHLLTAICVAQECSLVGGHQRVLVCQLDPVRVVDGERARVCVFARDCVRVAPHGWSRARATASRRRRALGRRGRAREQARADAVDGGGAVARHPRHAGDDGHGVCQAARDARGTRRPVCARVRALHSVCAHVARAEDAARRDVHGHEGDRGHVRRRRQRLRRA